MRLRDGASISKGKIFLKVLCRMKNYFKELLNALIKQKSEKKDKSDLLLVL